MGFPLIQSSLSDGAVTSVAGKTGAVTLVESDIGSLTTDLAAKAPISLTCFDGYAYSPHSRTE